MEEVPLTRAHLESLTTAELIRMADTWGIDIPPDLERIFIIEELLDVTSRDTSCDEPFFAAGGSDFSPEPERVGSGLKETAPLPKQYNITFIEVMVRDPLWAFVFWEIKSQDKEQFENSGDFGGYYLKVSPVENNGAASRAVSRQQSTADGVFTVPVKPEDNAWYLGLSPVTETGGEAEARVEYKVELCVEMKGDETVIIASGPFALPGLPASAREGEGRLPGKDVQLSGAAASPLVCLSGYRDFNVLRSNERTPRVKKGAL